MLLFLYHYFSTIYVFPSLLRIGSLISFLSLLRQWLLVSSEYMFSAPGMAYLSFLPSSLITNWSISFLLPYKPHTPLTWSIPVSLSRWLWQKTSLQSLLTYWHGHLITLSIKPHDTAFCHFPLLYSTRIYFGMFGWHQFVLDYNCCCWWW